MNTTLKLGGGVIAACAACCAVSIVPAIFAGTSLVAMGGTAFGWKIGLLALVMPVVGSMYYYLSRPKVAAAPNDTFQQLMAAAHAETCGCGPSCNSSAKEEAPVVCTLDAGDFKERTASIRDLARRSLRHASRTPLTLTLTYLPEALDEVRGLVAMEQTCCAFLEFDLKNSASSVLLTITAPKSATDAADALFDHFAPELAALNFKETV